MKYLTGIEKKRGWRVPYSRTSLRNEIAACRERLRMIEKAAQDGVDIRIDKDEEIRLVSVIYRCRLSAIRHYCFKKPDEKLKWTIETWQEEMRVARSRKF
jgi:hypothetical protein